MPRKSAIVLLSAAMACAAAAGPTSSTTLTETRSQSGSEPVFPGLDFVKASFSYAGGMDLDDTAGELETFTLDARSVLSGPIEVTNDLTLLPMIQYKATRLNWKDTPAGFPIEDEDVHSIALSSYVLYNQEGSPWIFAGWARAELATDFQHLNGDDVTFDLIAGAAYKFSDRLTFGLGIAAINLNNDEDYMIGPVLDWKISDTFRIGVLGPDVTASYTPDENWEFSLRGYTAGDEWNIRDAAGNSTTLDLDSYRVGLFADRRLGGDLWLRVGGGVTVMNEIEIKSPSGSRAYKDDMDSGWFGEIALRLNVW
ncbi:MAG: hypothetical protein KF712_19625 [Akkermansiaceae bacterium]|nr:hypothetical protein [Akkermansiaceae bacterium]